MKVRRFFLLMFIVVLLYSLCQMVFAVSETFNDNLSWSLDDAGTLTISGEGAMTDYKSAFDTPWNKYRDSIKMLVIEEGVTNIGERAFMWCDNLTSVIIGGSVRKIGSNAFMSCDSLTSVTIPSSVTTIDSGAFIWCDSLSDVYYSGSEEQWREITVVRSNDELLNAILHVATISGACGEGVIWILDDTGILTISGAGAMTDDAYEMDILWDYADTVKTVVIGKGVTAIRDDVFWNCRNLSEVCVDPDNPVYSSDGRGVLFNKDQTILIQAPPAIFDHYTIPDSVITIGECAFEYCERLTSVTIPDGVEIVEDGAFYVCDNLVAVNIPESVTTIGEFAFWRCSSLDGIWVENDNAYYSSDMGGVLFNKNKTNLIQAPGALAGTYIIPDGVTTIENNAFEYCNNLISVAIPDSVITVGDDAFGWCDNLTCVLIGGEVKSIGEHAFGACSNLKSFNIPDSVATIGNGAFEYCDSLTGIWVDENNPSYCSDDRGVLLNKEQTVLIQTPGAMLGSYKIPDGVKTIGDSAFSRCVALTEVIIPDSIIAVDCRFDECDSLTFNQYNGGKYLGNENNPFLVLMGATEDTITSCTVHKMTRVIADAAFNWHDGITFVSIPSNVITIGEHAFAPCENLNRILVDANNPSYSSDSFGVLFNKSKTELIQAPGAIVGDYTIPDSVKTICENAFWSCENLTAINIPSSVTTIECAFTWCYALTDVYYDGTEAQWGKVEIDEDEYNLLSATIHFGPQTIGDLDSVAGVDESDAIYLLLHVLMPDSFPVEQDVDFDGNGMVDEDDAIYLLQHVLMPDAFPLNKSSAEPPITEPLEDVLIINDSRTISNQTIDTDVYITSTADVLFDNVVIYGDVYCYGKLTISGGSANNLYAYYWKLGSMTVSCGAWDGTHGLVVGSFSRCGTIKIMDDSLDYAFDTWGKR